MKRWLMVTAALTLAAQPAIAGRNWRDLDTAALAAVSGLAAGRLADLKCRDYVLLKPTAIFLEREVRGRPFESVDLSEDLAGNILLDDLERPGRNLCEYLWKEFGPNGETLPNVLVRRVAEPEQK